jgi:tetratricopeptide (TPR) repeat protein
MKTIRALMGIAFALVLFFVNVNPAASEERLVVLSAKAKRAVVFIKSWNDEGRARLATGFFINHEGLLVSNHHVLSDQARRKKRIVRFEVITHKNKRYHIEDVLGDSKAADVAVARVALPQGVSVPYLRFREKLPKVGRKVVAVGNPKGLGWTVSDGIVSAIRIRRGKGPQNEPPAKYVQFTAPATRGSSGSPLIDMKGLVVGVISHGFGRGFDTATGQLAFASASQNVLNLRLPNGELVREELHRTQLAHAEETFARSMEKAKSNKESAKAYERLGASYGRLKMYEKAEQAFKQAVKLDPNFALAHYYLGVTYVYLKQKEKYIGQCKILDKIDPKRAKKLRKGWKIDK